MSMRFALFSLMCVEGLRATCREDAKRHLKLIILVVRRSRAPETSVHKLLQGKDIFEEFQSDQSKRYVQGKLV